MGVSDGDGEVISLPVDEAVKRADRLVHAGDCERAVALLLEAAARDPGRRDIQALLGLAYLGSGRAVLAERAFRALVQADSGDANSWYNLGTVLSTTGRSAEAESAFEAALRARPDFPQAQRRLAGLRRAVDVPEPSTEVPAANRISPALAELLDDKKKPARDDDELAGAVLWSGRPLPTVTRGWLFLLALTWAAPPLLHAWAESLAAGSGREFLAGLWHIAEAAQLPALVLLMVYAVARWAGTRGTLREHRVEFTHGVLTRRLTVLWYYQIELQPELRQSLLERALGWASIVVESRVLPIRALRLPNIAGYYDNTPTGKLHIGSMRAARARELDAKLRAAVMWERRRMLSSYIANP